TTTPQGRNEFGRYFIEGLEKKNGGRLYCQTGSSLENPHLDHELLELNIAALPDRLRRQNVYGEIVAAGGTFFDGDDIDAAIDTDLDLRVTKTDSEDREAHAIV